MGRSVSQKLKTFARNAGDSLIVAGDMDKNIGKNIVKTSKLSAKIGAGAISLGSALSTLGPETAPVSAPLIGYGTALETRALTGLFLGGSLVEIGSGLRQAGQTIHNYTQKPRSSIKKEHHIHYDVAHGAMNNETSIKDHTHDKELSTHRKIDVWKSDNSKDVYIGYEGTQLFKKQKDAFDDLEADYHILTNTTENSKMFKDVDKLTQKVYEKYPDHSIHMAGTSLGGKLAHSMACKYNPSSAVTFNMGINGLLDSGCEEAKTRVVNYTTGIDPISTSVLIQRPKEDNYIIKRNKKIKSPHSLLNFDYH
jgi:hypothetical protein